jgi:hypothetical protein
MRATNVRMHTSSDYVAVGRDSEGRFSITPAKQFKSAEPADAGHTAPQTGP